ncbi:MAG: Crp/Fnr family transcriptional regulator [Alphaproteobacteria bacterium]|nr:Crp/Fnr family transcriptional regulator [Alphaproteobacteria bacterium]
MSISIVNKLLSALPVFSNLDYDELRILAFIGKRHEHKSNQPIYEAYSQSEGTILLSAGRAILHYKDSHRPDVVARRGMLMNELALFMPKQFDYDISGLEMITTYHFGREDFIRLIEEFPEIGKKIQYNIAQRLATSLSAVGN